MNELVTFEFGALHKRLAALSADVHAGAVGVEVLPHGGVIPEHLCAALVVGVGVGRQSESKPHKHWEQGKYEWYLNNQTQGHVKLFSLPSFTDRLLPKQIRLHTCLTRTIWLHFPSVALK